MELRSVEITLGFLSSVGLLFQCIGIKKLTLAKVLVQRVELPSTNSMVVLFQWVGITDWTANSAVRQNNKC